jgi:hypothetical protein
MAVHFISTNPSRHQQIPNPVLELLRERDFAALRRVADRFEDAAHRLVLSVHDRNVLLSEAGDIRAFLALRSEQGEQ